MVRPRIDGPKKKKKTFQRISVEYSRKLEVLNYTENGHTLDDTI
ncbi:hypothetical protein PI125_g17713 [Phytophthora idaei]|nr:hypothetical protein PI125_g17713 [Phytophthora idaei]